MRRLAEGALELAAEVGAGEPGGAGHVLDADLIRVARVGEVPGPQQMPSLGVRTPSPQSRLARDDDRDLRGNTPRLRLARWRSDRRRSPSAVRGAGRGSRPRSGWRCSARSAGGRCACRGTGPSRRSPSRSSPWPRSPTCGDAARRGRGGAAARPRPSAALALAAASLPFVVEGHFGILGTGFDPDMSQHLLSADHLAHGGGSQLLRQGYPLGPHVDRRRPEQGPRHRPGPGLRRTCRRGRDPRPADGARRLRRRAAAVAGRRRPRRRPRLHGRLLLRPGRLQGGDAGALRARLRPRAARGGPQPRLARRLPPLRPGGADRRRLGLCLQLPGVGLAGRRPRSSGSPSSAASSRRPATGPAALRALGLALLAFLVLVAPEIGRMVEFHSFETFDPNGPGLGNLFGRISPAEALGIWPSGDFRLSPGDGAVPALGYYLGAAFAGDPARLRARPLPAPPRVRDPLRALPRSPASTWRRGSAAPPTRRPRRSRSRRRSPPLVILVPLLRRPVGVLYLLAAGGCSLLAFANAPVGPTDYSPALTGLRPLVAADSTLVLASRRLLDEEQGERYIAWELRGGRVCIEAAEPKQAGQAAPRGPLRRHRRRRCIRSRPAPYPGLRLRSASTPTRSGKRRSPPPGQERLPPDRRPPGAARPCAVVLSGDFFHTGGVVNSPLGSSSARMCGSFSARG